MTTATVQKLFKRATAQRVVGLDAGSATVKIVELQREGQTLRLLRYAVVQTEKKASEAIHQARQEVNNGFHRIAMGLASPEVVMRPFDFPPMPKKELQSAIRLEAEQAILNGHTLHEMAVDWQVFPAESGERLRGILAVVPKSVVSERIKLAEAGGIRPSVIDVEGLALWNAYWALLGSRHLGLSVVGLVHVGAGTTTVVVAKGSNELGLVRDVRLGGIAINEGRSREWLEEIRDSLSYARSQGGLRTIDAVYVSGGYVAQGIHLLRPALHAPVTLWNPLEQLQTAQPVTQSLGPLLTVAIGLALR